MEVNGVVIEDAKEKSITNDTVILSVDLGKTGNRIRVKSDSEDIDTEIDRKMLHIGVDLFDAAELRACLRFQNKLKRQIRQYTVPSFFRGGMYLIKLEGVPPLDEILKKAQEDFIPVVTAFADVVDQRRDESKERLRGAYDPKAYPSRAKVLTTFRIEYRWLSMATPTTLKQISVAIFEAEKAKAEDAIKAATSGITSMLAEEAKGLADGLLDKLELDDQGKTKRLNQKRIDSISKFLATFNLRNIGTSEELNAQVDRMQKLLQGVDTKNLRDNELLRADVKAGFAMLSTELDKLIEDKPARYMDKEA